MKVILQGASIALSIITVILSIYGLWLYSGDLVTLTNLIRTCLILLGLNAVVSFIGYILPYKGYRR